MKKRKQTLLCDLRRIKGISQRDLASIIGVSYGTIALYETGKRNPSLQIALKISSFFGVPVEQIKFDCSDRDKVQGVVS